jgi:hypothetical protein
MTSEFKPGGSSIAFLRRLEQQGTIWEHEMIEAEAEHIAPELRWQGLIEELNAGEYRLTDKGRRMLEVDG